MFEMPNLSPKMDQLPLFQFTRTQYLDRLGYNLFWVVQPSLTIPASVQKISFNYQQIYESALRSIAN